MTRFVWIAAAAMVSVAMPLSAADRGKWTRAWTSSLWEAKPDQRVEIDNQTVRTNVRVGTAGSAIRLRLGNDFSDAALRIGAASVRLPGGKAVKVTFNGGRPGSLIAPDAPLLSDPIPLPVKAFDVIEMSIYLPEKVALGAIHNDRGDPTSVSATGDFTQAATMSGATSDVIRPVFAGVDVLTPERPPIVVAYGDSITDNVGCADNAEPTCSWGTTLAHRLAAAGMSHVVLNQGIGGNQIFFKGGSDSAQTRFDRDVLAVPGVRYVVMLEGVNDIRPRMNAEPEKLIDSYRQIIARAHEHDIKVVGMTVLPFGGHRKFTADAEAVRVRLNDWIRTSGNFDAVVDLAKVIADDGDATRMRSAYDSGDHLHPNAAGETAMGKAIPVEFFR